MGNLKKLLYGLSYQSGLSKSLFQHKEHEGKLILTYHNILPAATLTPFFTNNVDVATDTFEFQIKSLLEKFRIQPAEEIIDPAKKGIYLSFDDGMLNQIEIVEPILNKHGITAMFAICSGLVQNEIEFTWRDEIFLMLKSLLNIKFIVPDLPTISGQEITVANLNTAAAALTEFIQVNNKMDNVYGYLDEVLSMNNLSFKRDSFLELRYSPMNIMDVKYLKNQGHLISSHTNTHRKLSMLSETELRKELDISKEYFTKEIGDCDNLVYPYGTSDEVNNKVRDFADKAGYKHAFLNTMKDFKNDDLLVPRINMGNVSTKSQLFGILAGLNKIFHK